tara:strand:- start:21082 stop:21480 length:399 start_codon:yes stop_codon:yes gene_type:complete
MATQSNREIYSDFRNDFAIHPIRKDILKNTNENAVKQSIMNILQTSQGERLFQPTFGGDLRAYLFENVTPFTEKSIQNAIISTIENYEPRAGLIDVIVSANPDLNQYSVSVTFYVINKEEPIQLDFILDRVR